MKKIFSLIMATLALLFLSACSTVESKVTRFHSLPATNTANSFTIVSQGEQRNGLEFSTYSRAIANKLSGYGWRLANGDISSADMAVFLSYGIDNGQTVTGSLPLYGQTGGGTSYSHGNVYGSYGSASYSGTTYTTPTFGVVGSMPYSSRIYARFLTVDILEVRSLATNTPQKVFEGRVRSVGTSSDIAEVLPTMIEALFKSFPGKSGKTETVNLPFKRQLDSR